MAADGDEIEQALADARRAAAEFAAANTTGRRVTITDIARLSGVSKKTVSRIINRSPNVRESTRRVVDAIMNALDYVPDPAARGLNFPHNFLVGLIYDNPNPQYVVNMQEGILQTLKDTEFELLVHPCDRTEEDFLDKVQSFVQRQRLYGVILTPSVSEDERLARRLAEIGCRHIRVASVSLGEPDTMLVTNDALGARQAARHIVEMGHTRIAHLAGREGFRSAEERLSGFREGLEAEGLALDEGLVFRGDYTFESGLACGEDVARMASRPTAIFCANDQMAAGFLQAMRRSGLAVPGDMSVVGYDDFQLARITSPKLTTIHSPTRDFARVAASRLLERDVPDDLSDLVAPWLVVRGSSGPAPA